MTESIHFDARLVAATLPFATNQGYTSRCRLPEAIPQPVLTNATFWNINEIVCKVSRDVL